MNELDKLKEEAAQAKAALVSHPVWDRSTELIIGGSFLVFVLLMFSLMSWLIIKGNPANSLMRTFTVPLICVMAVFLVVIGYSEQQIAPVMGLLGTVAGYLLGRRETAAKNEDKQD